MELKFRLKREAFRHIEAEICQYHRTLSQIEALRKAIIESSSHDTLAAPPTSQGVSNVERRATLLADSILLKEMERVTGAIAGTYHVAREECRRVIWIRYGLTLEGWYPPRNMDKALGKRNRVDLPVEEMCKILAMEDSTFHRFKNGFVYGVAERLGWY